MRVGVADTTFSRVDMAAYAIEEIGEVERYTVPGMKDLAVACKKLIEEFNCDIVLALAWVGGEEIDEQCAHEANIGLIQAELMTNKHILKVFVHEHEGEGLELVKLAEDRVRKHARNALTLLKGKEALSSSAGKGKRQGGEDVGGWDE
jgi:riboflavin synthase